MRLMGSVKNLKDVVQGWSGVPVLVKRKGKEARHVSWTTAVVT
jgi:hypothetical protein